MFKVIAIITIIITGLLIYSRLFFEPTEQQKAYKNLEAWWFNNSKPNWEKVCHDRGNRVVCMITRPEKDGIDMLVCYPGSCIHFDQEIL